MVKLHRKPVSSLLNRCAAIQRRQCGECSTLWTNWEGTMWFGLVENQCPLFSTDPRLYKQDNMGSVPPYGLTGKVLWFRLIENVFLLLFSADAQLYKQDNMGSVLPYGLTGRYYVV